MSQKIIDLTHIIEPTGPDAERKFVINKHDALAEIPGKVRPEGECGSLISGLLGQSMMRASRGRVLLPALPITCRPNKLAVKPFEPVAICSGWEA